jgi:RNA polymerase sigma factor (sigma-70 family)
MRGITTQFIRQLHGVLTNNVEADFAELVRRYGSMVWGVCRRALPDQADAEDAFQTVFLVLVRRGKKLAGYSTVGPWLHRVAIWTARNIRRRNAHRLSKRATLTEEIPTTASDRDLPLDLDDALLALPEKFRSSIVLCHLLGFSRADAAAQLGCPEGTLSAWLSRGMARLRTKLGDLDPARLLGITAVAVPTVLSASAVRAAVAFHTTAAISSGLSSAIPQLVEGVIRMLWIKKATAASIALFAMFAFGVGIGVSTFQIAPAADGQEKTAPAKPTAMVVEGATFTAEGLDFDKILAALNEQLQQAAHQQAVAEESLKTSVEQLKTHQLRALLAKERNQPVDLKELEWAKDVRDRYQKDVDYSSKKTSELKDMIQKLNDYKLQYERELYLRGRLKLEAPNELDKKLDELRRKQFALRIKLDVENANSKLTESTLKTELRKIENEIDALVKQKELNSKNPTAAKAIGGYFLLSVEAKDAAWPYVIKEYGPDGKLIGKTAFDNSAALGRFLARAMKDSSAPKEVRISAQNNTPIEMLSSAIDACKAAGVAENYFKTADPRKQFAEWFHSVDKPKNSTEKENAYSNTIEELYRKFAETQKQQQQEEMEKNNRDAVRKAAEWLQKHKANEPPNSPKP